MGDSPGRLFFPYSIFRFRLFVFLIFLLGGQDFFFLYEVTIAREIQLGILICGGFEMLKGWAFSFYILFFFLGSLDVSVAKNSQNEGGSSHRLAFVQIFYPVIRAGLLLLFQCSRLLLCIYNFCFFFDVRPIFGL